MTSTEEEEEFDVLITRPRKDFIQAIFSATVF